MPDGTLTGSAFTAGGQRELDLTHPINRGIIAFWPGDDAGGGVMRDIGPLRLHARGATPIRAASPRFGRSARFDGSSSYAATDAFQHPGSTGAHSFAAWVRPSFSNSSNTQCTITVRSSGGSTRGFRLVWNDASRGFYTDNVAPGSGAGFQAEGVNTPFSAGEEHLIVFVYNSGGQFYWDGKAIGATGPLFGSWSNANLAGLPVYIGRDVAASSYWNGQLALIRHYARALTAREVLDLYRTPWVGTIDPAARLFHAVRRAGAAYTETLSETAIGADGFAVSLAAAATLAGPATGADVLATAAAFAVQLAGTLAGADTLAAALQASTSLTDAATLADLFRAGGNLSPAPAERTLTWRYTARAVRWIADSREVTWPDPDRTVTWRQ